MKPPEICPLTVRELMKLCWNAEASKRLQFPEICQRLSEAREVLLDYEELQRRQTDVNYSLLSLHEYFAKLSTDSDEYLLPRCIGPTEELYLTVLE